MGRVVHFEILADNPERAATFYESVFGWKVDRPEGISEQYWLLTTGPEGTAGINGGLMGRHFPQAVINTIEVDNLDSLIASVEAAGGQKVHGPNNIPGVGKHAYCKDTEGNIFGALEPPKQ